mmetsp:Transcript_5760/g.15673  ORF Transcript_5760/g.15673 Transcript_5760/m.15673 type:complete len:228 (-) Transcript_5760:56-739(-)
MLSQGPVPVRLQGVPQPQPEAGTDLRDGKPGQVLPQVVLDRRLNALALHVRVHHVCALVESDVNAVCRTLASHRQRGPGRDGWPPGATLACTLHVRLLADLPHMLHVSLVALPLRLQLLLGLHGLLPLPLPQAAPPRNRPGEAEPQVAPDVVDHALHVGRIKLAVSVHVEAGGAEPVCEEGQHVVAAVRRQPRDGRKRQARSRRQDPRQGPGGPGRCPGRRPVVVRG